jgi:inorganic pyrophosphatase
MILETFIGKKVHIKIDRPLGSVHPIHKHIWFTCNYGYLPGIPGGDGDNLDAYLLGVFMPVTEYSGICIAIIKRRDEDDDKLVVVPEGINYSDEQILVLTEYIERFHNSYVVRLSKDFSNERNDNLRKTRSVANIRLYDKEDYDRVIDLWHSAGLPVRIRGRDSRQKIDEQNKNGTAIFLIAEFEGITVGTVMGTHDGRKGWINRLAVDSDYRRQKIASSLVKDLEDRFTKMGLEINACLIEKENYVSKEFFRKLGYVEWDGKYYSKRKTPDS